MRIVDIAMFILIFNLMMGVVTQANYAGGPSIEYNSTIHAPTEEEINQTLDEAVGSTTAASTWEVLVWQIKLTLLGPFRLFVSIAKASLGTGFYIQEFIPIPDSLALTVTGIVDTIYIIGIIEFMSGRSIWDRV